MFVIRFTALALLLGLGLPVGVAYATDCSGLPTSFNGNQFPTGDFFTNFNNPCYTIGLATGYGSIEYGDTNAVYYQIYFQVDPRYQLILLGDFPNTRYFSVSLNDAHSALSGSILDTSIVPLTSHYINPYMPGGAQPRRAAVCRAHQLRRNPRQTPNRLQNERVQRGRERPGRHPAAPRHGLEQRHGLL